MNEQNERMDIDMKKAVFFPVNYDNREIFQYEYLIEHYNVVKGIALERFCDDTNFEKKTINYSDFFKEELDYDTIILWNSEEQYDLRIYEELIGKAISQKKEIAVCENLYSVIRHLIHNYDKKYVIRADRRTENEIETIYGKEEIKILKNISTPIVCVLGMGDYCNKFACELELRDFFVSKKYKVLQIGSKDISGFFGIYNLPNFLYKPIYSLEDKAFLFNYYLSLLEETYQPDNIIIGIPGGILPANNKILNGLGEVPFVIMNSIKVDIGILCIYHNAVETHIINEYINCCKYRFNTKIENILVSNTAFTFDMDRDMRSLKYYHLEEKYQLDYDEYKDYNIFSINSVGIALDRLHQKLLDGIEVL